MIKILHVGEYVQGGVATYIKTLITTDIEDGVENHLLLASEKSEHNWALPADRVHYYEYKRGFSNVWSAMRIIQREIDDLQPNIIYCHSTWAGVLVRFPFLVIQKKCCIIYNAHGWSFLRDTAGWKRYVYAGIERILTRVTDKVINVSKYEYNSAVKYNISADKMCVIYSGISPKKSESNIQVKIDVNKINLLFVGRFDPQKGIDILLDAFTKCQRPDLHLYVIGDNVISNGMRIKKENTENITFLGWMSNNDVGAYYQACDVVVMPSRWEAFGLVAIEAMKYGKPIIVSDRGALPELITEGENGYIFDIKNKKTLTNIFNNITKEKLIKLGMNADISKFTAKRMIEETKEKYEDGVVYR